MRFGIHNYSPVALLCFAVTLELDTQGCAATAAAIPAAKEGRDSKIEAVHSS